MRHAFTQPPQQLSAYFTQKREFGHLFNLAYHVGDDAAAVSKRYAMLQSRLQYARVFYAQQVHGTTIAIIDAYSAMPLQADALITRAKNTAIVVHAADCTPICIYDDNGTIAVVHAGRAGAQQQILSKTLRLMQARFDCNALHVALGPSIKVCCYDIGADLAASQPLYAYALSQHEGRYFLDIEAMLRHELAQFDHLDITYHSTCTKCEHEHYFSYRHHQQCGRQAAIMLWR